MNVRHAFSEAIRSIRANAAISFAATVAALLALFLLGAFIPTFDAVNSEVDKQKRELFVKAYLRDEATVTQVKAFEEKVKATEHVKDYRLVSKEEARRIYIERFQSDPARELGVNPLPRSFEITPDDANNGAAIADALAGDPALIRDAISPTGVDYGGQEAEAFLSVANFIKWGGLALVILLVIASILLIANTIRLSIFARRREVEVMKLVGATNWFIRWPFMIEGVICGVVGALLAIVLLTAAKFGMVDNIIDATAVTVGPLGGQDANSSLRDAVSTGSLVRVGVYLVIAGALVGAIGSGLTLRRFLRV